MSLTPEQIAEMREIHKLRRPVFGTPLDEWCEHCGSEEEAGGPCDAARLLDALEEAGRHRDQWREIKEHVDAMRAQAVKEKREAERERDDLTRRVIPRYKGKVRMWRHNQEVTEEAKKAWKSRALNARRDYEAVERERDDLEETCDDWIAAHNRMKRERDDAIAEGMRLRAFASGLRDERDDYAEALRNLIEAWGLSWDCSHDPGHQTMRHAVRVARDALARHEETQT